jgi:hypothetical protein
MTAEVQVRQAGPLSVALYDVLGREVAVLHDGPATPGRQRLDADVSALPAGVYVLRAVASGEAVSARVTVAR